jgi:hypothetical protein
VGAGYSWKAFIDGGAFVHRYGFSTTEANVSAIGVQPYVNVHLLRQTDRIPVSLAANGNFQYLFYHRQRHPGPQRLLLPPGRLRLPPLRPSETVSVHPQATLGYDFRPPAAARPAEGGPR